jgi:hypothetical protein
MNEKQKDDRNDIGHKLSDAFHISKIFHEVLSRAVLENQGNLFLRLKHFVELKRWLIMFQLLNFSRC